jgi:hypothetical protein
MKSEIMMSAAAPRRSARSPSHDSNTLLAAALILAALGGAPAQAGPRYPDDRSNALTDPARSDVSLAPSMAAIAQAFRSEKAEPLTGLLPEEGKIFLSLDAVGGGAPGYYGRDQVYFIFSRIFGQQDTVRFDIRQRKAPEPPGKGDRPTLAYCVADWSYRRPDGRNDASQLHFVFSLRKASWSLVEIREAQ